MIKYSLLAVMTCLVLVSCNKQKLDEHGGYFDEKLNHYIYVHPGKSGMASNRLGVSPPRQGVKQTFHARVVEVPEPDMLMLEFDDRQGFMLLAQEITSGYKDEKLMRLKVQLHYVKPNMNTKSDSFKSQWKDNVLINLKRLTLNKNVLVIADYYEMARILKAVVMLEMPDDKNLSVNLWMVAEGLSLYYRSNQNNPDEELYAQAEANARQSKKGIWAYL